MGTDTRLQHRVGEWLVALPDVHGYAVVGVDRLLTPALLIYPDFVLQNVRSIIDRVGGDPDRWRAHVKSAKLSFVMGHLIAAGITHLKCATTLELCVACEAGARDVLFAYPAVGPKIARIKQLAQEHPNVRVSALVEDASWVADWKGSGVGLFVDVNPGMDRTGIPDSAVERIVVTARAIAQASIRFGGLHYYDGHIGHDAAIPPEQAEQTAHRGYDRLLTLVRELQALGIRVPEIVTAGTPTTPFSLSYPGFRRDALPQGVTHRVSPGTVVYNDASSVAQLPADWNLRPAAVVATTVVSHPVAGRITCDAGHKSVSADEGVPTCAVLGRPDLKPLSPSEEHLPIAVPPGMPVPAIGDVLYLVPRHVCSTVNSFDHAVIVRDGVVAEVQRVTARGRETPISM